MSYLLGFTGPSLVVDTACSSSLVALHLARRSLQANECSAAVVAAADLLLSPYSLQVRAAAGMLSKTGKCRTFGAQADGYVRGEGAVCVVLKRMRDVAPGDVVHAVLRGSAINQDGRSARLTAPCGIAQQEVIKAALRDGGLEACEIQYVEAHGTGTSLGDPIELNALRAVYGAGRAAPGDVVGASAPLVVGALKSKRGTARSPPPRHA